MIFAKKIEKAYREKLFHRYDDNGCVFYFSDKDFEGLKKQGYDFCTSNGDRLRGYFYSYENPIEGRLVIFDHGMGAGHRAYMREIEMLAKHGYLVFSYDHTGCMESEGKSTNGFAQSLSDLNDAVNALKADELYKDMKISIMGHSWGAFATMNISALHPDLSHIIAMSGFISVENILKQNFSGIMNGYRKHIYEIEKLANPDYIGYSADKSLANTNAKILIIHSDDDEIVKTAYHFDVLRKALSDKENVRFILLNNKRHNPNYTEDAVKYMGDFFKKLNEKLKRNELNDDDSKKAFVESFDWNRMTAQDENLWNEVFSVLDN